MRTKVYLPKTLEELRRFSHERQSKLWARYVPHPYKRQLRALWYHIHCESAKLKIEVRHMQKIRKYMDNPDECLTKVYRVKYNLITGTEILRTFRGKEYRVVVGEGGEFFYNKKSYKTLSAIAKEICGNKVSGYEFFALARKQTRELINAGG